MNKLSKDCPHNNELQCTSLLKIAIIGMKNVQGQFSTCKAVSIFEKLQTNLQNGTSWYMQTNFDIILKFLKQMRLECMFIEGLTTFHDSYF